MKDDLSCVDVFQGAASHANRGPVREEFDSSGMDSRVDNVPDMSGLCTIMTNYLTRIRLKRGDDRRPAIIYIMLVGVHYMYTLQYVTPCPCHRCHVTCVRLP